MTQDIQQVLEKAIGQPPNDMTVRDPNQNSRVSSLWPVGHLILDASRFLEHVGQRKPEGVLHLLRSKLELLTFDQKEGVSGDDERRARSGVADDVVQTAKVLGARQFDPDLLEGFTSRRAARRIVAALQTTTRKRHMPRPRVPLAHGPLDQEHFDRLAALAKHDRNGSMCLTGQVGLLGHMRTQFFSNDVDFHVMQLSDLRSTARAAPTLSG
jgi:hypothetical protein